MKVIDSVLVALFIISIVFFVLLLLNILIKLFSLAIAGISGKTGKSPAKNQIQGSSTMEIPLSPEEEFSSGHLKLKDVDEPTAAMIMAIVSDESGIPLSELCFKSIKLVKQE